MAGHELHSIKQVRVVGPHSLHLTFEDGYERDVDLSPVLYGQRFGPLRDPGFFSQVRLNRDLETVEWPSGADFDPETLYHWDQYVEEMSKTALKWREHEVTSST
jgi:hypothetical protein